MKIYLYILFLAVFSFTSCKEGVKQSVVKHSAGPTIDLGSKGLVSLEEAKLLPDILCQTWDYKEDIEDVKDMGVTSDLEVVYRGYCFFKDGTAIKDPRGDLKIGKWRVSEMEKPITISMEFEDGKKETCQLAYLTPFKMILATIHGKEKKTTDLCADAIRHVNPRDDPFYRDNVLWRIKPTSAEPDNAIKKRLKDCIHFFVLFYDQKINAHAEKVTFLGLPSCFNWHAGGIFLAKENELQRKWIGCFYNKDQALKAYRIADKLLSKKYEWPKKGNWLELNASVLKQMENKIDSIN